MVAADACHAEVVEYFTESSGISVEAKVFLFPCLGIQQDVCISLFTRVCVLRACACVRAGKARALTSCGEEAM